MVGKGLTVAGKCKLAIGQNIFKSHADICLVYRCLARSASLREKRSLHGWTCFRFLSLIFASMRTLQSELDAC